jgi:hypothetical protein
MRSVEMRLCTFACVVFAFATMFDTPGNAKESASSDISRLRSIGNVAFHRMGVISLIRLLCAIDRDGLTGNCG